jgi:hypothetical protein
MRYGTPSSALPLHRIGVCDPLREARRRTARTKAAYLGNAEHEAAAMARAKAAAAMLSSILSSPSRYRVTRASSSASAGIAIAGIGIAGTTAGDGMSPHRPRSRPCACQAMQSEARQGIRSESNGQLFRKTSFSDMNITMLPSRRCRTGRAQTAGPRRHACHSACDGIRRRSNHLWRSPAFRALP